MLVRRFAHLFWTVFLLFALASRGPAADASTRSPLQWTLLDQNQTHWRAVIFQQGGWQFRLTALSPEVHLDHQRPLELQDPAGGQWRLTNRSAEMVSEASEALPANSAQFSLESLQPSPSAHLPLLLSIHHLEEGPEHISQILLGPEPVQRLHQISLEPLEH